MTQQPRGAEQLTFGGGVLGAIWKHRLWWMLPLGVLLLLLAAIYVLEHLSKTDSEMYPTSSSMQVNLPYSE